MKLLKKKPLWKTPIFWLVAVAAILMLLNACAARPITVARPIKFHPTAKFLDCVADEYEQNRHGPCTKEVVKDWEALVE
jgi:hypothetical protein